MNMLTLTNETPDEYDNDNKSDLAKSLFQEDDTVQEPVFSDLDEQSDNTPDNSISDSSDCSEKPVCRRKKLIFGPHIEIKQGDPPVYKCSICGSHFKWKHQVRYHDHCVTGKRPFKCKLCEKRFVKRSLLENHTKTHSGETNFRCLHCGKGFIRKDKLKLHEKIHYEDTESVKFKCPICEKSFTSQYTLKNHSFVHDPSSKPHKCTICDNSYPYRYALKRHMLKHAGMAASLCQFCGRPFQFKDSLVSHVRIHHSGEGAVTRQFKCDLCAALFTRNKELIRHKRKHQKIFEFECTICAIKFGRKDNLLRHVKNSHPCEDVKKVVKRNSIEETKKEVDKEAEEKGNCTSVIVHTRSLKGQTASHFHSMTGQPENHSRSMESQHHYRSSRNQPGNDSRSFISHPQSLAGPTESHPYSLSNAIGCHSQTFTSCLEETNAVRVPVIRLANSRIACFPRLN